MTNRLGGAVKVTTVTNGYTELKSGVCYVDAAGVWRDSVPEIVILPDGTAEAARLPHKVRFGADLAASDAIRVTLPTGEQMHSTLRGLVLYDPANRVSAEVARVAEGTLGYLLGTNRIAYSNAFRASGIWADVVYTISPAGLEQDIALHTAPDLETLATATGISLENAVLEAWTEYSQAPEPQIESRPLAFADSSIVLTNELLRFSSMKMAQGRAYLREPGDAATLIQPNARPLSRVSADWEKIDNRRFLIEGTRVRDLRGHLERLGTGTNNQAGIIIRPSRMFAAGQRHSFPKLEASPSQHAAISPAVDVFAGPVLVLDYIFQNISDIECFRAHETYYISGPVNISHDVVFEGSTCLKFSDWTSFPSLIIDGTIECKSGPANPIIFTGRDDDGFGEQVLSSTGDPTASHYGYPYLQVWGPNTSLSYCKFLHGAGGVYFYNFGAENEVRHSQFVRCWESTFIDYNDLTVQNTLFWNVDFVFMGAGGQVQAEHVTAHASYCMADIQDGGHVNLVNSLAVGVPEFWTTHTSTDSEWLQNDDPVFASSSLGSHYLPATSEYRAYGAAANISSALRNELAAKTTQIPEALPSTIDENTTLQPRAARNTGSQIDIGYCYDPIDYISAGTVIENASTDVTLSLRDGVCVALDDTVVSTITVGERARFVSEGMHKPLNRIVRSRVLQEGAGTTDWPVTIADSSGISAPHEITLRFTEMSGGGWRNDHLYLNAQLRVEEIALKDCQITGGWITMYLINSGTPRTAGFTNNLLDGVGFFLTSYAPSPATVRFQNNTFRYGTLNLGSGNFSWAVRQNLFDHTTYTDNGQPVALNDNGFHQCPIPNGSGSGFNVLTLEYVSAPLGRFYVTSGSPLVRTGTLFGPSAADSGLVHYTIVVGGGDVERADVGFHYVKTTTGQVATDDDSDGIPDYHEDINGNGVAESTETSFLLADTDNDGLTDAQDIQLGYNPLVADTDSNGTRDGDEDMDADRLSNAIEYGFFRSDPTDAYSVDSTRVIDDARYQLLAAQGVGSVETCLTTTRPCLHIITGTPILAHIHNVPSDHWFDLYDRDSFDSGSFWRLYKRFLPPETDIAIPNPLTGQRYFFAMLGNDEDHDEIPDGFEFNYVPNAVIAGGSNDGRQDQDGDGFLSAEEYHVRTHPGVPDAHLEISWTMTGRLTPPFGVELVKGPGYRVFYQADDNGLFKITFDQRHRGLQLKDWLGLYSGLAGVTHVYLPPNPGQAETWRLRYNYRTVSVFRKVGSGPELPFTSASIQRPLPEWMDNITENVTGPNTTANAVIGAPSIIQAGSVSVSESGFTLSSKYVWEGVVGNTSACEGQRIHSGPKVHAAFRPILKMCINPGTREGFYIVGYNEPRWDAVKFDTDNPLEVVIPNIGKHHGSDIDEPVDIAVRSKDEQDSTMTLWIKRSSGKIQRFMLNGVPIDADSIDLTGFPSEFTLPSDITSVVPESEIIARAQHDDSDDTKDRIAIYRKTTQQVYVFKRNYPNSPNNWIQEGFIIGRANGYETGTDVVQSDDPDFRTKLRLDGRYWDDGIRAEEGGPQWVDRAVLCYDNQRRLWVSDTATSRMIRFEPDGTHDGTVIGWPIKSYASSVDTLQPTRVFCGYLEYSVNYSLPLSDPAAWSLVRYWGHLQPRGNDLDNGLVSVRKFSNGATYAITFNDPASHNGGIAARGRVVRLDSDWGLGAGKVQRTTLEGSAKALPLTTFEPDGSTNWIEQSSRTSSDLSIALLATFRRSAVTGFGTDDGLTPSFDNTGTPLGIVNATGYDPVRFSFKIAGANEDQLVSFFSNTKIDLSEPYRTVDFTGFHLGAIQKAPASEQPWLWRAARTEPSDGLGVFEKYQQPQDVQFAIVDDNIFALVRGEFWKDDVSVGRQANQILHYRTDGVFLGQFGLPTTIGSTIPNPPGGAGNMQKLSAVKAEDGTIYVYVMEENARGVHRWRIVPD